MTGDISLTPSSTADLIDTYKKAKEDSDLPLIVCTGCELTESVEPTEDILWYCPDCGCRRRPYRGGADE